MAPQPMQADCEQEKRKTRSNIKQILLLLIIQREEPIGRYRLKTLLGMTMHEGIVRHMLEEYQAQGVITSSRHGATLTPQGHEYLHTFLRQYRIRDIQKMTIPFMSTQPTAIGVQLEDCADHVTSAMNLRDIAIRGGATSATVVNYRDKSFTIPAVDPTFIANNPALAEQLQATFTLKPNDVIVLISADSDWQGLEAAIHVATSLSCY